MSDAEEVSSISTGFWHQGDRIIHHAETDMIFSQVCLDRLIKQLQVSSFIQCQFKTDVISGHKYIFIHYKMPIIEMLSKEARRLFWNTTLSQSSILSSSLVTVERNKPLSTSSRTRTRLRMSSHVPRLAGFREDQSPWTYYVKFWSFLNFMNIMDY